MQTGCWRWRGGRGGHCEEDSSQRDRIAEASELLAQLLVQDIERAGDGVSLKQGVSRDRMVSVHDPDMRHGHKSSSRRFDGHKASVAVDTDSQLITAVDVLAGNATDSVGALGMVERSERNTSVEVEETMGDVAYGDGMTRQEFADTGRALVAKLPRRPEGRHFPKEDFEIDLEPGTCTCPAGHTTDRVHRIGSRRDRTGRLHRNLGFRFDSALCGACSLRERCVAAGEGKGRTVSLHPQEALLQQARVLQSSDDFGQYRQRRVVVEHRLARLVQLGMRQARYFGRTKTLFQLLMAAAVANLTLVAGKVGLMGEGASGNPSLFSALLLTVISEIRRSSTRTDLMGHPNLTIRFSQV